MNYKKQFNKIALLLIKRNPIKGGLYVLMIVLFTIGSLLPSTETIYPKKVYKLKNGDIYLYNNNEYITIPKDSYTIHHNSIDINSSEWSVICFVFSIILGVVLFFNLGNDDENYGYGYMDILIELATEKVVSVKLNCGYNAMCINGRIIEITHDLEYWNGYYQIKSFIKNPNNHPLLLTDKMIRSNNINDIISDNEKN